MATVPVLDGANQVIDYVCVFMLQPLSGPNDDVEIEIIGGNACDPAALAPPTASRAAPPARWCRCWCAEESAMHQSQRQRGVALVEFALILPLLLVLTFITTEFGRALYEYQTRGQVGAATRRDTCRSQLPDRHQTEAAQPDRLRQPRRRDDAARCAA